VNRDDIISMAHEASGGRHPDGWGVMLDHEQLERFANLIAAAEREAIANLVEQMGIEGYGTLAIAVAIRAKGQA
jgi:predicted glutamine amidotransferase